MDAFVSVVGGRATFSCVPQTMNGVIGIRWQLNGTSMLNQMDIVEVFIFELGRASSGRPIKKCPGVSAPTPPSSAEGRAVNGLLFRHASIWTNTVDNSSKVSLTSPTTRERCLLKLFTAVHCSFPQASKMRGPLRNKIPHDVLVSAEVGNHLA